MGRFRAEAIRIKKVGELTIVFYDAKRIYVQKKNGNWTLFHRWGAPRGFYGSSWKYFRKLLMREKTITFEHCYRLAFRYDIGFLANVEAPDLEGKKTLEMIFPIKNKEVK